MIFDKNSFVIHAEKSAKKSPVVKDCVFAFLSGGSVCAFAEALLACYKALGESEQNARSEVTFTLIFLTAVLTGLGLFDKAAKYAGAGTFVPITGFANAMASAAVDTKAEGLILGVGKQMFVVAGPVLVYGTAASALYGAIYFFARSFL